MCGFPFSIQNLDLPEVLVEVEKRGSSFDELLAIPEQDDWIYEDGQSVSCVAYVLQIYKAAGLFGPLSKSIQATEFTVSLSNPLYSSLTCSLFNGGFMSLLDLIVLHDSEKLLILYAKILTVFLAKRP